MSSSNLLEPLVSVIETIKQRIEDHGASLRENETRTRVALIDPILQSLGWDISDPSSVTLEYDVQGRRADYALLRANSRPAATIEAKKLGEALGTHRMQMLNYANASGVDFAGLTDGNHWELYEVFKRGELSERELLKVTIADSPSHESALKLLRLWWPNLASGAPVEAQHPIVGLADDHFREPDAPQAPPPPKGVEAQISGVDSRWTPLPDIQVDRENPPRLIRFDEATEVSINYFYSIVVEAAKWLANKGELKSESLPLRNPGGGTIANSSPQRADGTPMLRPKDVGTTGIFVETNLSGKSSVQNTVYMLNAVGMNPRAVLVCLLN